MNSRRSERHEQHEAALADRLVDEHARFSSTTTISSRPCCGDRNLIQNSYFGGAEHTTTQNVTAVQEIREVPDTCSSKSDRPVNSLPYRKHELGCLLVEPADELGR
jgi:hypothetical protein